MMAFRHILLITCMSLVFSCGGCRSGESRDDETGRSAKAEDASALASRASAEVGQADGSGGSSRVEGSAADSAASTGPETIADLSLIKVHEGMPSPQVGDLLYTGSTLPKDVCGEYWVRDSKGYVSRIAICSHPEGHH